MIILKPDHIITGEEYVRSITNCSEEYKSDLLLLWTPICNVLGSGWKGTTISKYQNTLIAYVSDPDLYEYALIDPNEYFPNKKELNARYAKSLGWR